MNFDWIKVRARTHRDKVAIIETDKKREWTYHELNIRAENLANYLVEQGVSRGDRIGVFAPNDVAIADFFLASVKIGAVFIPLNWRLKPNEIERVIENSGTQFIVNAVNHEDRLERIPSEYIKLNIDLPEYDAIVDPKQHKPFKSVDLSLEDPAFLIYTSGSTGMPKGVLHTHQSYLNNAYNEIISFNLTEELRAVINVPLFHIIGFVDMLIPILMLGGTAIIERYFNPKTLNKMILEYKPNTLIMIPTMYYAMLASPDFGPEVLESLNLIVSGGAPPLPKVAQAFEALGKPIMNIYGLSEVPLVTFNRQEFAKKNPAAIGQAVMNGQIKIVDENMQEVEVGEIGELLVAGAHVFAGYWNLPEEDAKAFHDGYFRTGDLAKQNEQGEITIVNRLKELIITGGENVLPSEVEAVLHQHPVVKTAIVVGYDNPKYGESVSAAVILNKDATDYKRFEEALDEFTAKNLAGYKVPKLYLELEEIPVNSVGKPDRLEIQRLMNEYAKEIVDPVDHFKG